MGVAMMYLSVIVLIPLAALGAKAFEDGWSTFWAAVTTDQSLAALRLTLILAAIVSLINAVMGTLIAWVLVRDDFPGKGVVNSVIDLPFALPTIVAGLVLLALYGPQSPIDVDVAYTQVAVGMALLFVTLPFVVRAVQPLLIEMDRDMEEASRSLGASRAQTFARIVVPNLVPGIVTGVGLGFGRALGEFGSVVLISGNIPFDTEVSSVNIFGLIEGGDPISASAVAVAILALSVVVLVGLNVAQRFFTRHVR
jgi:sulfate transport system permease protein